ncbi:MAG: hypothetical protein ACR2MP_09625 [Streptosporangiaceae bacterium]
MSVAPGAGVPLLRIRLAGGAPRGPLADEACRGRARAAKKGTSSMNDLRLDMRGPVQISFLGLLGLIG